MKARIAKKIIKKNVFNKWAVSVADTSNGGFRIIANNCIDLMRTGHFKKAIIQQLKKQNYNILFHQIIMPNGEITIL